MLVLQDPNFSIMDHSSIQADTAEDGEMYPFPMRSKENLLLLKRHCHCSFPAGLMSLRLKWPALGGESSFQPSSFFPSQDLTHKLSNINSDRVL